MADERNEGGYYDETLKSPSTTGTGTATATEPNTLKVARHNGEVKLGTWKTPPADYEVLTTEDEIVDALMVFNASELRVQIANLCLNKF